MRKQIKRWGNSLILRFSPEEIKTYDIKEEDILDIEFVKVKGGSDGNIQQEA